jgi:rhodanese-related sulfurtransferase
MVMGAVPGLGQASDTALESYIKGFDYQARTEMKVGSDEIAAWVIEGKAQLVDIRFAEEAAAWGPGFGSAIPLPELPQRLEELDRSKIIVTACPHKDRAIIAMVYLRSKGYDARYLKDGLIGLAEHLRGDRARAFIEKQKPE